MCILLMCTTMYTGDESMTTGEEKELIKGGRSLKAIRLEVYSKALANRGQEPRNGGGGGSRSS